jgi:hypothetical protein
MPFRGQSPARSADTAEHDLAALESQDCPYCEGTGMVPVYAPQHDGTGLCRQWDETPFATVVGAHCCCSLGRWTRDRNKPDVRQRIPSIQDILDGRSRWMLEDPTENAVPLRPRPWRTES